MTYGDSNRDAAEMARHEQSLVSVVTPVYNGADFLRDSMQSVLSQTYNNIEYIVVDNGSTDRTPDIISELASQDTRIKVITNSNTLPHLENWNIGVSSISKDAEYFILLCADDTIEPTALEKMVALGDEHPSVGIVASLIERGDVIQGSDLPKSRQVFSGREIVRRYLAGEKVPIVAISNLIRASIVRRRSPFYRTDVVHADLDVAFDTLRSWDYAIVHERLAYIRLHDNSVTYNICEREQTLMIELLRLEMNLGSYYMDENELPRIIRRDCLWNYRVIVKNWLLRRDPEINKKHIDNLRRIGYAPDLKDFAMSLIDKLRPRNRFSESRHV